MIINKELLTNYLTLRYDPGQKSKFHANWKNFIPKENDYGGEITESLLLDSIKSSIPDNKKPISISLSSGIDSSLCLALLREVFPNRKIIAICGVFDKKNSEAILAKKIAKKFDADFKILQMNSIFTNMPEIIHISKKPRWNTYNHLISKEAKKYSNYIVTGDGADELFGGYVFRYRKFQQLYCESDSWKSRVKKYLDCHNRDWVADQELIFGKSINFDWEKIYFYFKPFFKNSLNPLTQVMLADFNGKLIRDFIPTGQAIFNYYNLIGVPIFLNSNLISFSQSLPLEQKYDSKKNKGKLILRKIANKYNIPHIDEKKGFSPSLIIDWKNHGEIICKRFLLNTKSEIFKRKLVDYNWILFAFEKVEQDGDIRYLNRLISIFGLEIWVRIFITRDLDYTKPLLV